MYMPHKKSIKHYKHFPENAWAIERAQPLPGGVRMYVHIISQRCLCRHSAEAPTYVCLNISQIYHTVLLACHSELCTCTYVRILQSEDSYEVVQIETLAKEWERSAVLEDCFQGFSHFIATSGADIIKRRKQRRFDWVENRVGNTITI